MDKNHLKKLGQWLSLKHHSQGLILIMFLFFFMIKAWWSMLGLVFYGNMHLQYGGAGTFQHPQGDNQDPGTIRDLCYVTIGISGLMLIIIELGTKLRGVIFE